ncbi:helix-turn-helix protein [Nocardia tenerifensis]|uniref:Helix-turn-helix protein n=1 Tax=Nocardia tenerifensis TaxID=228006 RepID=A0A318K9N8_9NOCA|nr:helix-turn-helix transcriptional regulator [Nocardia tenerifensis]PXX70617.1 helix-turn-helix protein [Nocardia tenerifensis]
MSDHIADSIKYMWENCGQQVTLDDLADVAQCSKFYFVRRFRAETSWSPVRFLAAIRLARSKKLLASTSMKVSDISYTVGYLSYGTFTSQFTKAVGLSPSQYRRYVRGEQVPLRWSEQHADCGRESSTPLLRGKLLDPGAAPMCRRYMSIFSAANPLTSAVALLVVPNQGTFSMGCLPPGKWIARAISVSSVRDEINRRITRDVRTGICEFRLRENDRLEIGITLSELTIRTPPFLLALPQP